MDLAVDRRWWAVAALLAIFAMHGLATHGLSDAPSVPAAATGPAALDHADHEQHAAAAPAGDGEHHGASVLGLCVAVIATAAIALLRLVRPDPGLIGLVPRAASSPSRTGAVVHGPAPPDLHALSVLRC